MRLRAHLLALTVIFVSACTHGVDAPPEGEPPPRTAGIEVGEPYAYSEPAPPEDVTPLDGRYLRSLSVSDIGWEPVYCRRCAPWRLDAGDSELRFERGRFYARFEPVETPRRCPDCSLPPGFQATGHYRVVDDLVELFNDPNCIGMTGVYAWSLQDGRLNFEVVEDECPFVRLRSKYLTAAPWEITG